MAAESGKNGYYEEHPVSEGFTKEQLILTDEALDRAVARTLEEMFALGLFENPYRIRKKLWRQLRRRKTGRLLQRRIDRVLCF